MNQVKLIGNVGKDVIYKDFDSGKMLSFSLATNEDYVNKNKEQIKSTVWHSIVAWGPLAEKYVELVEKGKFLAIEGKLSYRQYQNKEQVQTRTTEIVAFKIEEVTKKEGEWTSE